MIAVRSHRFDYMAVLCFNVPQIENMADALYLRMQEIENNFSANPGNGGNDLWQKEYLVLLLL